TSGREAGNCFVTRKSTHAEFAGGTKRPWRRPRRSSRLRGGRHRLRRRIDRLELEKLEIGGTRGPRLRSLRGRAAEEKDRGYIRLSTWSASKRRTPLRSRSRSL